MDFAEHQFSITPRKTPEEITAELEQKRLDAAQQRHKELLLVISPQECLLQASYSVCGSQAAEALTPTKANWRLVRSFQSLPGWLLTSQAKLPSEKREGKAYSQALPSMFTPLAYQVPSQV